MRRVIVHFFFALVYPEKWVVFHPNIFWMTLSLRALGYIMYDKSKLVVANQRVHICA